MPRYWVIAPYDSTRKEIFKKAWEFDISHGTIALGWAKLGNVHSLSLEEYNRKYKETYPTGSTYDRESFWKYMHEMSIGDKVIARQGRKVALAVGEITDSPYYDEEKGKQRVGYLTDESLSNFIDVHWEEEVIRYPSLVFMINTIQEINESRFNDLVRGIVPSRQLYTWVPIYKELAAAIMPYRNNQADLLSALKDLADKKLPIWGLMDKDANGESVPLTEMDPFTFFAAFNRGLTEENRSAILEQFKRHFGLTSDIPDDFDGIPVVNNQSSWFFPYKKDRGAQDIADLWSLAAAAVTSDKVDNTLFDRCLKIKEVGFAKLTQGLFWIQPDKYLPFDSRTRAYLRSKGIASECSDFEGYKKILTEVKTKLGTNFPQISHEAYRFTSINDNQLVADVLEADINAPHEEWQEKVNNRILPFFSRVNALVERTHAGRLGDTNVYKRKAGDDVRGRECLTRWQRRLTSRMLPKDRKISVYVQLGDVADGDVLRTISWGLYWWGAVGEAEEVYDFYERLNAGIKPRKNPAPYFGGMTVKLVCGEYGGADLDGMTGDIKEVIEGDIARILDSIDALQVVQPEEAAPQAYKDSDALAELFMAPETYFGMKEALLYKKNIIIQGPPGTGKTFVARRLAYAILGNQDRSCVQMIQFHQSYSYEDFIQGYRPADGGAFVLKNGVFFDFVKKAQNDPGNRYFFIIDEINRANLSKVFGELLLLIEPDKRGPDFAIPLTYAKERDEGFYIPENLYLIGTMNTADRSITIVDYAVRRRFLFCTLKPEYGSKFEQYLLGKGISAQMTADIKSRLGALNEIIVKDDKNLGQGFEIGHSYFCPMHAIRDERGWYNRVIDLEIRPLLMEYWFDDSEKARKHADALLMD